MKKVLIIKTGYSEVLDNSHNSRNPSFGDIIRTTPLLHVYKEDDVTWVTDEQAMPLLQGNPYIDRLLPLDFTTAMRLLDEEFDVVINLEKNPDICKLSNKIEAWSKYGFRFDKKENRPEAYDRALEVLTVSSDLKIKQENKRTVQELLFEMVGTKWQGEDYVLGYTPKSSEAYDIGLNTQIGKKWPIKSWPAQSWDSLESILVSNGYTVTRQDKQGPEVTQNLYGYMDWINSSRMIVSNDSLGLHLALAMKKKVIGLFGPTAVDEIYFYNRGKAILPEPKLDCMPCLAETCSKERRCIEYISPERIYSEIKSINLK